MQGVTAIENSILLYDIIAVGYDRVIGMGRLLGDGLILS